MPTFWLSPILTCYHCISCAVRCPPGIALENIICYANKAKAPFSALPPSYYFVREMGLEPASLAA